MSRLPRRALPGSVVFALALLLAATTALAAPKDHLVRFSTTIAPPSPASVDISWVENSSGRYFLADRSNKAIDLFDARTDTFTGFIGQGQFTGNGACNGDPFAGAGPDGVVTDSSGLVWAGDGNSTIKVLNPVAGTNVVTSIGTGGKCRADELSFDPRDQLILIANDAEGFLTFIDVSTRSVAGHFYYADNTLGQPESVAGHATAGGGLEQSVWDAQTGLFYQAVPAGGTTGFIDVFDPVSERLVASYPVPGCDGGPTGLALGENERFLGACGNGAVAVELRSGRIHAFIPEVGGADEIWFNPGDDNFYLAIFAGARLGVVNADNDKLVQILSGRGSHSVAAYAGNNHIFDPGFGTGIAVFVSGGH
ncbi:MAG TPA: hypothetical protein VKV26_09980 [Dehalococcoidia bacterium]|nr:hypothetical protein [Dehalococcoidia bacterium]